MIATRVRSLHAPPAYPRCFSAGWVLLRREQMSGAAQPLAGNGSVAPSASQDAMTAGHTGTNIEEFEAFFWRHEHDILGYLWRLTGDEQTAYDLSQEVFIRAWQHFEALQRYEQPRAWLFRVASNLGINHLRGRTRRPIPAPVSEDMPQLVVGSGDPAHRLAEHDAIRQTLLGLPPRQRAAVTLCDVYGMTSTEAAEALGVSHGSLKMSLWRGRERFRQDYQRRESAE